MKQLEKTITSLEVAEMVGREHRSVTRDIRNIVEHLGGEHKIVQSYFIESTYTNSQNKQLPCYRLTKKGCELFGTRMTGAKGTQFAVAYIERFNEMEQELQTPKLPTNYKEALVHLLDKVEENEKLTIENHVLAQQVSELQPKATYYDMVLQNKSLLSISTIAKDYGMSGQKLNGLLHKWGVQYKRGCIWLLYAKYQDKGYTHADTHVMDAETTKLHTKWTQNGRLFLYDLLKSKGILPMIERNGAPTYQLELIEGGGALR